MTITNAVAEKVIARGIIIKTAFLGPTNYKGSRVTASHKRDNDKTYRAIIDWRHDCDAAQNHARAAQTLINVINKDRRSTFVDLGLVPANWNNRRRMIATTISFWLLCHDQPGDPNNLFTPPRTAHANWNKLTIILHRSPAVWLAGRSTTAATPNRSPHATLFAVCR